MSNYSSLSRVLSPFRVQTNFEENSLPASPTKRYAEIMLGCIVLGEKNAFPVDFDTGKTIGHLKGAIKEKKSVALGNIDANDLKLWKVNVPESRKHEIYEGIDVKVKFEGKELESDLNTIGDYFEGQPTAKHIHIIVEPPPPATTEPQRKSITFNNIEEELERIIKDASQNHHMTEVNMWDVEKNQKQKLGRFYREALPHGTTANKMILAMFGQILEMAPMTNDNKTLLALVESDIGETSYHKVVAMVGRSGAGKTATIVDLAKQHFVVYCVCSDPASLTTVDFADPNFVRLAKDVEQMATNLQQPDSVQALKDNDTRLKQLVGERVELEFLARLLLLQLLFEMKPDLTPEQFFRDQMNGGATTIGELVGTLGKYNITTIRNMLFYVQKYLKEHLNDKNQGLVIALDEAHIAGNRILAGKLISPSALSNELPILNRKNELEEIYRRGFLTPLCATLSDMHATLVVLGTSLSLADAEQVYSAVGKMTNFRKIINFPKLNEQDVDNLLKHTLDLSECVIPPDKRRKLTGRPRFSSSVIGKLNDSDTHTKQDVFIGAVDLAIDQAKNDLKKMVQNLLANKALNTANAHLLGRMVLAYKLHNGKISFARTSEADFVNNALCSLSKDSDDMHLIMDEPLVIEVVEEELKSINIDPEFLVHLDQINQVIENLGTDTTAKGNMLEPLIRRCLQRFNGYDLIDLPFLKGLKGLKALPKWCEGLKFQINEVNTANGFGYEGNGHEADLLFLKDRPANKMLIEHSGTRQDGMWFFNNQYAGSIGIKLYSDFLKESIHIENETSTDIRSSFLKKDGTLNPSLQKIRENFEASRIPSDLKGILRIHFEFPGVKGFKPETSVKRDSGVEDVMVYIDCSNMDDFFYENIHENQNDVHILKNIIRYVTAKSGEVFCNCQKSKCENERCSCVKGKKKCGSFCKYCESGNCNNLI